MANFLQYKRRLLRIKINTVDFLIVLCQLLLKTSFHRSCLKTTERLLHCHTLIIRGIGEIRG
jgi:hypothetical protein